MVTRVLLDPYLYMISSRIGTEDDIILFEICSLFNNSDIMSRRYLDAYQVAEHFFFFNCFASLEI